MFISSASQLQVGDGYPQTFGEWSMVAVIYATSGADNALCDAFPGSRRRRDTDTGSLRGLIWAVA